MSFRTLWLWPGKSFSSREMNCLVDGGRFDAMRYVTHGQIETQSTRRPRLCIVCMQAWLARRQTAD